MNTIRKQIINAGKALLALQLQNSHSGNLSYRSGGRIFMTRSGSMKGHLENRDIISFDMRKSCHEVDGASTEAGTHQGILQYDRAVIHTHSVPATLISYRCDCIQPVDWLGKDCLKSIPVREFEKPVGSPEMEKEIPELLSRHRAMVVRAHGPFVRGTSLEEALAFTFVVDSTSTILLVLRLMGVDAQKLIATSWPSDLGPWEIGRGMSFSGDTVIRNLIKKVSSDVFLMGLSPFFSGSLSIRHNQEMIYCDNVSSPEYFNPSVVYERIDEEKNNFFLRLHQNVYTSSKEESVLFAHTPDVLIQAFISQIENSDVIIPVDAEGSLLYPDIPIIQPTDDVEQIVSLALRHRMVVLPGLGVLSVGKTPQETLHHCSSLKNICRIKTWTRKLK